MQIIGSYKLIRILKDPNKILQDLHRILHNSKRTLLDLTQEPGIYKDLVIESCHDFLPGHLC